MNLMSVADLADGVKNPYASTLKIGRIAGVALASMLVLGLSACSGGQSAETIKYCDSLRKADGAFTDLQAGDMSKLGAVFQTFHGLADDAPQDITDDWRVMDGAITQVETSLEEAGLSLADFESTAMNADPKKLQAVLDNMESLSSEEVSDAADAIEKHALDDCDVKLADE